jgi:ABC-2 type transport system permease protein
VSAVPVVGPVAGSRRLAVLAGELRKVPAFVRRDFLVAWSYRISFVSDIVNLTGQVLLFAFVGKMVNPDTLPTYGGTEVTYLEFASVGIALAVFVQFGLTRVGSAVRGEQLMGTLESVLMTPTAPTTVQLGSVAFDLVYIPVRTALFLGLTAAFFGLHFSPGGALPAFLILLAFIPFVWGLGVAAGATILTIRRGGGMVGFGVLLLGFASGIYFPVDFLPGWIEATAAVNPIALAIEGVREALLGQAGLSESLEILAVLAPLSLLSLALGLGAFRLALSRERRRGTLGLY